MHSNHIKRDRGRSKWLLVLTFVLIIHCQLLWQACLSIVSLQEYCDAFPDNLKPVICIIKENKIVAGTTTTTIRSTTRSYNNHRPGSGGWGWTESWGPPPPPPPPPPFEEWHESRESSESEESAGCSCDLTCIPRLGGNVTDSLQCKQCGNNCEVTTTVDPKCNCAAVGSGLSKAISSDDNSAEKNDDNGNGGGDTNDYLDQPLHQRFGQLRQGMMTTIPACNCSVTCAHKQRWDHGDQEKESPFCIFNITGLHSLSDRRPVTCECCKSKASLHTNFPDFVCICEKS